MCRESKISVDFSVYDQAEVAVILRNGIVFRGIATFVNDDELGRILRIRGDSPRVGDPRIILAESSWSGRILDDGPGTRIRFIVE